MPTPERRPHTGRRRNDAARLAILTAAAELLAKSGPAVTVSDIAAATGVSKHTIYRWWPSKGAVLLDAVIEFGRANAPDPQSGTFAEDLRTFLDTTFAAAANPPAATLLRAVVAEAQTNPATADLLSAFVDDRRSILRAILQRAHRRGELAASTDLELVMDQVYGVLWYRLTVARTPVNADIAARLADSILHQV